MTHMADGVSRARAGPPLPRSRGERDSTLRGGGRGVLRPRRGRRGARDRWRIPSRRSQQRVETESRYTWAAGPRASSIPTGPARRGEAAPGHEEQPPLRQRRLHRRPVGPEGGPVFSRDIVKEKPTPEGCAMIPASSPGRS